MFCRDIGWKEEEDAVEAREGVCNMTDMLASTVAGKEQVEMLRLPGPKPLGVEAADEGRPLR